MYVTLNVKYVSVVCATVVISASQGVHVANVRLLKYSEQYLQLHKAST
jgi:hypothetical protein